MLFSSLLFKSTSQQMFELSSFSTDKGAQSYAPLVNSHVSDALFHISPCVHQSFIQFLHVLSGVAGDTLL